VFGNRPLGAQRVKYIFILRPPFLVHRELLLSHVRRMFLNVYLRGAKPLLMRSLRFFRRHTGIRTVPPILKALRDKLEFPNGFHVITPDGIILYADPTGIPWMLEQMQGGTYEPDETLLFRRIVKPGMKVVDAGAHIGYYTLLASKLVGPSGRVSSFEPTPNTFAFLRKNTIANNATNTWLENKALSDFSGTARLHLDQNPGENALFGSTDDRGEIDVITIRLDDFLGINERNLDVMKLDIEGSELKALLGSTRVLQESPNLIIFTEFSTTWLKRGGSSPEDYLKTLLNYGFHIHVIDEVSHRLPACGPQEILDLASQRPTRGKVLNLICGKQPPVDQNNHGTCVVCTLSETATQD
jgi:FkbM family methyltransferase